MNKFLKIVKNINKGIAIFKSLLYNTFINTDINFLVTITLRKYLFPYRTQKSSSNVPMILTGYPVGKIGCC